MSKIIIKIIINYCKRLSYGIYKFQFLKLDFKDLYILYWMFLSELQ